MKPLEFPLYAYSRLRSLHFALQYAALNTAAQLIPGVKSVIQPQSVATLRALDDALASLLKQDAHRIATGIYPLRVLQPESPVAHLKRLPRIIADGLAIYRRRAVGRTAQFGRKASLQGDDLPRYFKRNFHFQTDGYLSEKSARLYEHQVEMLFGGAADAMRRLIIAPLKQAFRGDGAGLTFLEIGAGTGRATRFVRLAFPKARVVVTDLSEPYLKVARAGLAAFDRLDFVQAPGEKLPFQDSHFDAVYSVFLFHELPLEIRKSVLAESRLVLKKGGFLGLVDSMQLGDIPTFDELLETFPKNYHEPFYRNYISHPMEGLVKALRPKKLRSEIGFLSKALWARL